MTARELVAVLWSAVESFLVEGLVFGLVSVFFDGFDGFSTLADDFGGEAGAAVERVERVERRLGVDSSTSPVEATRFLGGMLGGSGDITPTFHFCISLRALLLERRCDVVGVERRVCRVWLTSLVP